MRSRRRHAPYVAALLLAVLFGFCLFAEVQSQVDPDVTLLLGSDTNSFDNFGYHATLTDSIAIISATARPPPVPDSGYGAIYVFRYTGTGPMNGWEEEADLWGVSGGFPRAVAYARSGNAEYVAGGAPYIQGPNPAPIPGPGDQWEWGAVHLFRRDAEGTGPFGGWAYETTVQPEDVTDDDRTGDAVALVLISDGGISLLARSRNDLVVFERPAGPLGVWAETQRLGTARRGEGETLAASTSTNGPLVVAGGPGPVYVFRRDASAPGSATAWSFEESLVGTVGAGQAFGSVMDALGAGSAPGLEEDIALVGAPDGTGTNGSAHIFRRDAATGVWTEEAILRPDGVYQNFGASVALGQDAAGTLIAMVGSAGPYLFVFRHEEGGFWTEVTAFDMNPLDFGSVLYDAHGSVGVVGSLTADIAGQNSGAAWLVDFAPVLATGAEPALEGEATLNLHVSPNPARDRITVRYRLGEPGPVRLMLYDALGRVVRSEALARAAGLHEYELSVSDLPPGMYAVRVVAGGAAETRWVTVLR